jgi:hypothetical protein
VTRDVEVVDDVVDVEVDATDVLVVETTVVDVVVGRAQTS